MVIFIWILIIFIIFCCVGVCAYIYIASESKTTAAIGIAITLIISAIFVGYSLFWLNGTEGGKRAKKSFSSNYSGGIEREVKIYDVVGNEIASYKGKFDIEYQKERIIFEDENGKLHNIYFKSGIVIVDEI